MGRLFLAALAVIVLLSVLCVGCSTQEVEGKFECGQEPVYEIALGYCEEMYFEGVLTHDGFKSRADSIRSNGYTLVGENLARGFETPEALVEAWLLSPTHKDNIMNPLYFYTGMACYKGYTCQIFGGYDLSPFIKRMMFLSSLGIRQEHFEELK